MFASAPSRHSIHVFSGKLMASKGRAGRAKKFNQSINGLVTRNLPLMSNLIDITGDDISLLNDTDLRVLIGLLCEADYRASNLSTSGITYGGNQDASDGGLDVVVKSVGIPLNGFIKRASTGIQVKKSAMPRAEIIKEMKPNGILRDEIRVLINDSGAYIIVSSGDSATHSMLKARQNAMRDAVKDEVNNKELLLDFFDRSRIASWVRNHPSLILWVRDKIGRPISGWRPYENWSHSPGGLDDEYLFDDRLRFHDNSRSKGNGLSVQEGFSKLRSNLSLPKSSVRLTEDSLNETSSTLKSGSWTIACCQRGISPWVLGSRRCITSLVRDFSQGSSRVSAAVVMRSV